MWESQGPQRMVRTQARVQVRQVQRWLPGQKQRGSKVRQLVRRRQEQLSADVSAMIVAVRKWLLRTSRGS